MNDCTKKCKKNSSTKFDYHFRYRKIPNYLFLSKALTKYLIQKIIVKVRKYVNKKMNNIVVILLICTILTDLVFSSIKYLN